ncbi:LysR family transcriptional regulator [Bradyrhizobium sp. JYMT SZCCT0428]|uniref:LysR family transcriptional regulator n=1 Tax=Bradyrhizobium sp. JYMT SZCCT0428 TaxID=2807673 RepID=UPI001BA8C1C5|nr:LysR family transcriptional regulator [Bradyrhizobium sp. JYMT SZCCT0428]MBR1157288.1 LysR family transcriptional regulator [Bradyrhizobium sp. JYMT SZCCT0428]
MRYFAVTAEEGHITRAAERLNMQQPPLSRQIKALERELGVQLFRRKARGVELTDAGHTLLQASRDILPRVQRAIEATQRTAQGEQGQVRIGAAPTAPFNSFVPRVIRAFREAFPRVTLTIEESLSHDLFQRLRDDQIDVAFYRSPPADGAGLKLDSLLTEPMIMAVPIGNPLAKSARRSKLSLRDFADETFIVYGRRLGPGLYDATVGACHDAGFSPRLGQEAPRIVSTLNLVAAGLGVAMVPASLQHMKVDGVRYCPLSGPVQPKALLALASRRGDPSASVRQFLKLVVRMAAASSRPSF